MMRYWLRILLILMAFGIVQGCDWFEELEVFNMPPETTILDCPIQGLSSGDSLTVHWEGSDEDGRVTGYEFALDRCGWMKTTAESVTIRQLPAGEHVIEVRAIDDRGESDPTPAECLFTVATAGRYVERCVLVELFTTTWCRNCPNSEEALAELESELGESTLCVVAYHDTPERDGLATTETAQRIDWYWSGSDFPGDSDVWPTVVFDGLRVVQGAQSVEKAKSDYEFEIDSRLMNPSPLSLAMGGSLTKESASIRITVCLEHDFVFEDLTLNVLIIEDSVAFHGWFSDNFDFVVRDMLDPLALELSTVGDSAVVEQSIELDQSWKVENLDVIAFVQDATTKEVIQSARLKE